MEPDHAPEKTHRDAFKYDDTIPAVRLEHPGYDRIELVAALADLYDHVRLVDVQDLEETDNYEK